MPHIIHTLESSCVSEIALGCDGVAVSDCARLLMGALWAVFFDFSRDKYDLDGSDADDIEKGDNLFPFGVFRPSSRSLTRMLTRVRASLYSCVAIKRGNGPPC